MIEPARLKDAERVVRCLMATILLTAGTSKFFSGGDFREWYAGQFRGDLRISLPGPLVDGYLTLIPFIEIALGLALLVAAWRRPAIYAWFLFMASLLVGHYVLQEWSAVNQMLDYFFLGLLALVLPAHAHWWRRDPD